MTSTRIIIEAVSPDKARLPAYAEPGSGDWFFDHENGDLHIRVTASDVWHEEDAFLVALHELVEARLCFKAGIVQGAVDAFDSQWQWLADPVGEPGDHPVAPYRVQHRQAMMIEHMMALFMGITDYGEVR